MVIAKRIGSAAAVRTPSSASRSSTCSTRTNFANPPATLPNAIPAGAAGEHTDAGEPRAAGQPYTAGAAGTFGRLTQTVGTTVGLGTNRQVQFAFRLNF